MQNRSQEQRAYENGQENLHFALPVESWNAVKMNSIDEREAPDWDAMVTHYCHRGFIRQDPISFPHRYLNSSDWRDAEFAAFLASLFSYGRRDKILETLDGIFSRMGNQPVSELLDLSPEEMKRRFKGFYYRFNVADDLLFLLRRLSEIYQRNGSLKQHWSGIHRETGDIRLSIHRFQEMLLHDGSALPPKTYGIRFLFANPVRNSAAKRFNMFLRWVVRSDEVDMGLWSDVTSPAELMMPLDTHVASMVRRYRITQRKSNDWKTVEEITGYFRRFCPTDPVRYDFALFGLGLQGKAQESLPATEMIATSRDYLL